MGQEGLATVLSDFLPPPRRYVFQVKGIVTKLEGC